MKTYKRLLTNFAKKGIPVDLPDFYDHPNFVEAERKDPRFLNNFAFYVACRPYSEEYLNDARKKLA